MNINPLVLSLRNAFDIVVDPTICVKKKGKKMQIKQIKGKKTKTST
jgi:hypothetical protein